MGSQGPYTRFRRRSGWLVLILLSGCITDWESQPVTPAQAVAGAGDSEVRVTLTNKVKVVLRDPAVEHDSLVGWVAPSWDSARGPVRRAYALAEIHDVAVKKNNTGSNVVLGVVAGTALFFGAIMGAWAITCATRYCD
jgi:hypothetical protein